MKRRGRRECCEEKQKNKNKQERDKVKEIREEE